MTPAATGHGKLILFGEHAVVYGHPAVAAGLAQGARARVLPPSETAHAARPRLLLRDAPGDVAAPVDRAPVNRAPVDRVPVDRAPVDRAFGAIVEVFGLTDAPLAVEVTLELPAGAGLGSSAAMAVACARALAAHAGIGGARAERLVEEAVQRSEAVFHGNASGIDQTAALTGGVFRYVRTARGPNVTALRAPALRVAVCKAGPSASTARMVEAVAGLRARNPSLVESVMGVMGELATAAVPLLEAGDVVRLGELMNINHGLLAALGVSTVELDRACHVARAAGANGAKITGAGGGGCTIALVEGDAKPVLDAWAEAGYTGFEVTIAGRAAVSGEASPS